MKTNKEIPPICPHRGKDVSILFSKIKSDSFLIETDDANKLVDLKATGKSAILKRKLFESKKHFRDRLAELVYKKNIILKAMILLLSQLSAYIAFASLGFAFAKYKHADEAWLKEYLLLLAIIFALIAVGFILSLGIASIDFYLNY